jgi:HD-GYP domain-containing protein (c-di-GMP phosphodiesterase class II)
LRARLLGITRLNRYQKLLQERTKLREANEHLLAAYEETIEGLSHALDLRDKETEGHSLRVTELTIQLAQAYGLTEEEITHIRRGALLHDMGKIGVPDGILHKPAALSDEEWRVMRKHPQYVYDMLYSVQYLRPALSIPYCHHEKWDGTGYPRGLKGEQIPISARLFAVADVWDALTSDRPYRPAWSREEALDFIREQSGSHYDPRVVDLFFRVIES